MTNSLPIIADRGALKAYAVEATPKRGPMPRLLETFQIAEAHTRYRDRVTDQAGALPAGGTAGQGNAIAERMTLDAENETRILRQITDQVTNLLRHHRPEHWSFAAPSEINNAILKGIPAELRARLKQSVPRDLTKVEPVELPGYFE